MRIRRSVGIRMISRVPNVMEPLRASSSPTMVLSSVVLPAPLRPSTATAPRRCAARFTSNRTWLRPYETQSPRTSRKVGSDTSEIDLLHLAAVLDLRDRSTLEHIALIQNGEHIADVADEIEIVLDDDERTATLDRNQQLGGNAPLFRAHACGRLVKQQKPWFRCKRHCNLEPLLLPMRERRRRVAGAGRQAELIEGMQHPLVQRTARAGEDEARQRILCLQGQEHVVVDHECRQHAGDLKLEAQAGAGALGGRYRGDVAPGETDRPFCRHLGAGDALHQRTLAGAIGTDKAVELVLRDGEANAAQRRQPAENLLNAAGLKERHAGPRWWPAAAYGAAGRTCRPARAPKPGD